MKGTAFLFAVNAPGKPPGHPLGDTLCLLVGAYLIRKAGGLFGGAVLHRLLIFALEIGKVDRPLFGTLWHSLLTRSATFVSAPQSRQGR